MLNAERRCAEPLIVPETNGEAECLSVDLDDLHNRRVVGRWLMSTCWHKVVEWRAVQRKVGAPIEFGAVCTVHLSPAPLAISPKPEVGFFEISKEQKLSNFPHR